MAFESINLHQVSIVWLQREDKNGVGQLVESGRSNQRRVIEDRHEEQPLSVSALFIIMSNDNNDCNKLG